MRDLTPRQRQILLLVQKAMHESGMPPTRAEIAKTLKFRSVNAAEEHLRALERKGVIELLPGMSRGIRLKDSLREQIGLPLVGRVAAGQPILAEEHIEARYQIDPDLFKNPDRVSDAEAALNDIRERVKPLPAPPPNRSFRNLCVPTGFRYRRSPQSTAAICASIGSCNAW